MNDDFSMMGNGMIDLFTEIRRQGAIAMHKYRERIKVVLSSPPPADAEDYDVSEEGCLASEK